MQLYSAKEKQLLSDLVHTMVSFNLTYRQDRNSEGQYAYHLEPYVPLLLVSSLYVLVSRSELHCSVCVRTRVCVCVALPCIHVFMLLVLGLYI